MCAPQWFNAIRMMIAFACLGLMYRKEFRHLSREAWIFGAAAGASLALGYVFQTQGLLYTTATNSAFITALVVVIVPILATIPGIRPPGHDTPEWTAWAGAVVALLGVALLTMLENAPWTTLFTAGGKRRLWKFAFVVLRSRVFAVCAGACACFRKGAVSAAHPAADWFRHVFLDDWRVDHGTGKDRLSDSAVGPGGVLRGSHWYRSTCWWRGFWRRRWPSVSRPGPSK